MPDLHPDQIAEIKLGCYGLCDAPSTLASHSGELISPQSWATVKAAWTLALSSYRVRRGIAWNGGGRNR